ncbi:uncharacterized protein METZ01_LOCUS377802, partial [marine metagenome]
MHTKSRVDPWQNPNYFVGNQALATMTNTNEQGRDLPMNAEIISIGSELLL